MEKNLYIDASHPNETRVVLKSDDNIEDYEYEGLKNNLIKNNIYLGKVSRIEPSLQAAFIDFGRDRHGFLSFNDIQSDYYQIPKADLEKIKEEEEKAREELSKEVQAKEEENIAEGKLEIDDPINIEKDASEENENNINDKVIVDDFKSVYEATEYLIKSEKRKNILLVSNIEELSVGKLRINGYSKALQDHKLKPNILKLDNAVDVEVSIYDFLAKNNKIDAIISIDHVTGIVAINMAKKLGKEIPEDMSVVGFGYEHTQLLSSPKISIIHQKAHKIGEMSMKLLIDNIKTENHKLQTIVVPSELKLSESTM